MCGRQCDQSRLLDKEFEGKSFVVEGLVEQCDVGKSLSQLLGLFAPAAKQGLDRGGRMLVCHRAEGLAEVEDGRRNARTGADRRSPRWPLVAEQDVRDVVDERRDRQLVD
jgi:hypothetical protein